MTIEGRTEPVDDLQQRGWRFTDLTCVDCPGVLMIREEGEDSVPRYRCRVGHAYGAHSLMEAKEGQLESKLWAAVELLEEVASLHEDLAARERELGNTVHAEASETRSKEATAMSTELRELVLRNRPVQLPGSSDDQ